MDSHHFGTPQETSPAGTAVTAEPSTDQGHLANSATLDTAHTEADQGQIIVISPADLLPGVTGALVACAATEFRVTETWLRCWRDHLPTVDDRTLALSVMAGAQRERRHPSLRHLPADQRGAIAIPFGGDRTVLYRESADGLVWLAIHAA